MKRSLIAIVAGLGIAAALASPATAYDTTAYGKYAAGFVSATDIPKSLGTFEANPSVSISPMSASWYLCDAAKIAAPTFAVDANFYPRKDGQTDVGFFAYVYSSNVKAEDAFRGLVKGSAKCVGTKTTTDTTETGVSYTWTRAVTTGRVPLVTVTGVASVFLNSDTLSSNASDAGVSTSDTYSVFTLTNDTILQTQVISPQNTTLSAKQKKAANQLAFNAEGAWVLN